jgi:hypothetical protein
LFRAWEERKTEKAFTTEGTEFTEELPTEQREKRLKHRLRASTT